jgi:tRNA pseudouridine55 synthase
VKRVGHAGTLDPMATGVLPVLLGRATRLAEYLVGGSKTYVAEVLLGVETDTYDAEGKVLHEQQASGLQREAVEAALASFRGEFEQTPPAFSAVKRGGVASYQRARRGEAVELAPRKVEVLRLEVLDFEPPRLRLEMDCGKGFYVRSLAHDLGAALGTGAMLSGLVRTRVGPFKLRDAVSPDGLAGAVASGDWDSLAWAPDEVLLEWPAAVIGEENAARLSHGQAVTLLPRPGATATTGRCRAYSSRGDFLAVLNRDQGDRWRPERVFAAD